MLLFLCVRGAVCQGGRPGLPTNEPELPSDPVSCTEAKSLLSTLPDFNSVPIRTVKMLKGRKQLFLDNYVLARVENVKRQLHQPQKYGPVIRPDRPWEEGAIQIRMGPSWNPQEKIWMLWYTNGAYATSQDGIHWQKPILGLREHTGQRRN